MIQTPLCFSFERAMITLKYDPVVLKQFVVTKASLMLGFIVTLATFDFESSMYSVLMHLQNLRQSCFEWTLVAVVFFVAMSYFVPFQ